MWWKILLCLIPVVFLGLYFILGKERFLSILSKFWWIVLVPLGALVLNLLTQKKSSDLDKEIKDKKDEIEDLKQETAKKEKELQELEKDLSSKTETAKDKVSEISSDASERDKQAEKFFK